MSARPISAGSTVFATVFATAVPKTRKAMKFHPAAHATAWRGLRTPVAMMVATELAESWKPFV
jgi:hypothetical protein